jgi:hypothetical protein
MCAVLNLLAAGLLAPVQAAWLTGTRRSRRLRCFWSRRINPALPPQLVGLARLGCRFLWQIGVVNRHWLSPIT